VSVDMYALYSYRTPKELLLNQRKQTFFYEI
jgi:hypothetical protein